MSSDDDDNCCHRACDDAKRLDYSHMQNVVRMVAAAIYPVAKGEFTSKRINGYRVEGEAPALNY